MDAEIIKEFETLNLGDTRLDKRVKKILQKLINKASSSIPGACMGNSEAIAAYRFLNNDL